MLTLMSVTQCLVLRAGVALLVASCHPSPAPKPRTSRSQPMCLRVLPARLVVHPNTLATTQTPRDLALPTDVIVRATRSGKTRLLYGVAVCSGSPPTVGAVEHPTGDPDLDRFLDARIPALAFALPSTGCVAVSLLVDMDLACDPPKTTSLSEDVPRAAR